MIDMTEGNINKKILKFALPMILGNIFQQVYNLVDSIVVGKFIGADALASVVSSFAIIVFINSIIIGLSMGVGIILSQFYGSKDFDKFKECNLELKPSNTVDTPVINKTNTLTYECKTVYKQEMNPEFLDNAIKNSAYPKEDYHVLFYGEILDCYKL